jgi:hypothetical protein
MSSGQPLPVLPNSLTFNAYDPPSVATSNTNLVYSDDPVVRLFAPQVTPRLSVPKGLSNLGNSNCLRVWLDESWAAGTTAC